jgi:hypothetical protein
MSDSVKAGERGVRSSVRTTAEMGGGGRGGVRKSVSYEIFNVTLVQPADSMEQNPSWWAKSHSAGQDISCFLWIPKDR